MLKDDLLTLECTRRGIQFDPRFCFLRLLLKCVEIFLISDTHLLVKKKKKTERNWLRCFQVTSIN